MTTSIELNQDFVTDKRNVDITFDTRHVRYMFCDVEIISIDERSFKGKTSPGEVLEVQWLENGNNVSVEVEGNGGRTGLSFMIMDGKECLFSILEELKKIKGE